MSEAYSKPADAGASVEAVLERIAALTHSGHIRDAIQLAADTSRRSDDSRLAAELMQLRHVGFRRGVGRPDWPPAYPDPFPNVSGAIPEIRSYELSEATLAGGILHHGAIIIRGLLDTAHATTLRGNIDRALMDHSSLQSGDAGFEPSPWYSRAPLSIDHEVNNGRIFTEMGGAAVLAGDSPRNFQAIIDLYEGLGVFRAVESYFGERPVLSLAKTVLRRVPVTSGTEWHQDGAFLGASIRVVNVWLALSDCGVEAPGLDVIPRRIPEVLPTGIGSFFDWAVGEATVKEAASDTPMQTPVFRPGDAMMFDHFFLHRTAVRPSMTKDRYALEAWIFAPSTFPEENFALVV